MKTKSQCQQSHSLRRAQERYSVSLNPVEYQELCSLIKEGKATILQKQSSRVNVCSVLFKDKTFVLVYDKHRHSVVTFLPGEPEFLKHSKWVKPKTLSELRTHLESPKCPECSSFGEKVLWFSGKDTITFECIKCQTRWSEITHLEGL